MAVSKNLTSKTYLKGISDATRVLTEPERTASSYFRNLTASVVVPNLVASSARAGKDNVQDIKNMTDALKARIPGLSDTVPPRRNMFGEPIQDNGVNYAVDLINPFSYSTVSDDKLMKEFDDLGHGFSPPSSLKGGVELRDYVNDDGQTAYDRWIELSSDVRLKGRTLEQELRKLVKTRKYQKLPYESIEGLDKSPRVQLIQTLLNKYRAKAFDEMLKEFPDVERRDGIHKLIKSRRRAGRDYADLLALIEE